MKNYFDIVMNDLYHLLDKPEIKWPYELTDSQKVELLQCAILYFQNLEEYEKCAILKSKIKDLFTINKL